MEEQVEVPETPEPETSIASSDDIEVMQAEPEPEPVPSPDPEPEPEPVAPPKVSVLLASRIPDYESVAVALREQLGEIEIYNLSDKSLTPRETVDAIRASGAEVIVAIGYRAAALATSVTDIPVVYSQVFNTNQLGDRSGTVKGVSMLPPLDKQLEIWKSLNPHLESVGAIVGAGHDELLDEAEAAAAEQGLRVELRRAGSNRETLYIFTRMLPEIDGFWLFPDNRILSSDVLREMLKAAARHRVQVAVFNDSLLSLGATLSTTTVPDDIARTIVDLASRILTEEGPDLPELTPLSEIEVQTAGALATSSSIPTRPEGVD